MTRIEELRQGVRQRIESLESEYGVAEAFVVTIALSIAFDALGVAALAECETQRVRGIDTHSRDVRC